MAADELARLAALLADRSRAQFCLSLMDGRAWTAGELAEVARVSPATASEHLTRLVAGGLLGERRQGRHRYLQLAGPRVADLLEHLLGYVGPTTPGRSLKASTASTALARGRTCYDHLAGRLGVAITDAMAGRNLLDADLLVTDEGIGWLADHLHADFSTTRRPIGKACLDWTERRSHLAGAAGAHICAHLHAQGWVRKVGTGRAVKVTPAGERALEDLLGISGL
ncbi:DNA-binding transcriptional ArsR family regulator [Saccharothrix tamanrassetensis]|uniref:DNA-binding transcriptional ArsR family regulator n=1 Tax=Saccharothrix tamanrassetensis TaxID=1051531 RepID=A0A841CTZ5_9PSEU|nr:helix-turn-helix domain-containing protein [Saccharothrix tamanrassetensis]MBB5960323.1 DNA-binding transcriptional ArsR family regulator [Saccharothrix tamanrassetensis]